MSAKIYSVILLFCLGITSAFSVETLPLAGEWRFALDRNDVGMNQNWFTKTFSDKIQLLGVLESQGYGDEIDIHTPWVLSLYDHFWYLRSDYAAYTNAGNVKVPFLCQPPRHYLGAAWYQRDIEIPKNWSGKHVTLFLERPHWKSTVWLDDKEIGSDISLCVPHEYDLSTVQPGKHRITIRVDNRMILPYRPDAHSISDSLDNAWNGIVGKIELRATPPVWIENVQVFPNITDNTVTVKAKIGNTTGKSGQGTASISIGLTFIPKQRRELNGRFGPQTNFPVEWENNGGAFEATVPIGCVKAPQNWDEFNREIYGLGVSVSSNSLPTMAGMKFVTFGLRDFHTSSNQFILNGHPIYLRGTHFGGDFPLTGYPPTDVESWKNIFQTCKNWGLNHMRFHSWCPPEAAFDAADEMGIYLQVECGMWNSFAPGSENEKQLYSETERILKAYGNHPSLLLVSASNEAAGRWKEVLPEWVKHFRAEDPRHLYTPDTGWTQITSPTQPVDSADYLVAGRIGSNRIRGETGWFGGDYEDSIEGINVPVLSHELGQWVAYPDFDVIKKFTGFMRPGNYEIFRESAAAHGVLERNKEFAFASGKFQLACYKEEIEANLRTPGLAGFQLLDLHDYTGQGTALVGLLDPFWESKGYATPDDFKKFCNTVTPLVWLDKRTFATNEKLEAAIGLANFSGDVLHQTVVRWEIIDSNGKVVGHCPSNPVTDIPIGFKGRRLNFSFDLKTLPAPARYKLLAIVDGADGRFQNDWNFWLYPAAISSNVPANVFVTGSWNDAEEKLAAGGRVLFVPHNADLDWTSPPLARVPVFWNALMGPNWSRMMGLWCDTNHPALAGFPTDSHCNWQWTELLRNTRAVNLDRLPKHLQPIVSAIDDWNRNYKLGLIFEARVNNGKLLVCPIDFANNNSAVAQQLRRSLLDYMADDQFRPQTEISMADFESLHFDNRVMQKLGATATADGQDASAILDGDPNTFWCSADSKGKGPKPPHTILVSFPQPVAMKGLILMPRQNHREHQGDVRDYTVETSADGTNWTKISAGSLPSNFDPHSISFRKTITAQRVRFTVLDGFGTDTAAALSEFAIDYAGPALPENTSIEYKHVRTASTDIDAGTDAPKRKKQK